MEAWFSPQAARYFAFFALLSLMAFMSYWVKQGSHKNLVLGSYWVSIGLGLAMMIAAIAAWSLEQPRYVIRALAMTGFVITFVFCATMPGIYRSYQQADQRRIIAKDI